MVKKDRVNKGTHYSESETEQRSYFLPKGMGDRFKNFCQGNASAGARGAFVLFMACERYPELRERAILASKQKTIGAAIEEVASLLAEVVARKTIDDWAQSLPVEERVKLLAEALKRG